MFANQKKPNRVNLSQKELQVVNKVLDDARCSGFVYYPGNKNQCNYTVANTVPNCIYQRLLVMCAGGLSDTLAILSHRTIGKAIVNDVNLHLINLYKHFQVMVQEGTFEFLFDKVRNVLHEYQLLDPSVYEFNRVSKFNELKLRFQKKQDPIDYLALSMISYPTNAFYVKSSGVYGGTLNKSSYVNRFKKAEECFLESFMQTFSKVSHLIEFVSMDGIDFLKEHEASVMDLVTIDPPYFGTKAAYNVTWDEKRERELFIELKKMHLRGAHFVLMNLYEPEKINNPYLEQATNEYDAYVWFKDKGAPKYWRTEIIICNAS